MIIAITITITIGTYWLLFISLPRSCYPSFLVFLLSIYCSFNSCRGLLKRVAAGKLALSATLPCFKIEDLATFFDQVDIPHRSGVVRSLSYT
jgi:hypothetical protein